MIKLFLDIETVPAEASRRQILKEIHEKMEDDGKKVDDFEQMLSKTSFDGSFGRIACISYAIEDGPVLTLKGDEKQMIRDFWELAKKVDQFVGFNIHSFDLRFICQRSMILGIKPSKSISFAKFQQVPIFDVMCEWVKWDTRNSVSLHKLALAFGILSSKEGEIEGKNVAQAFADGRIDEICKYCEADVEVTREIYKKMVFEAVG